MFRQHPSNAEAASRPRAGGSARMRLSRLPAFSILASGPTSGISFHAHIMKALTSLLLAFVAVGPLCQAAETNLVANGSFELGRRKPGAPDEWAAAGHASVLQQLTLDTGRDGKRCAKLACSAFNGDGPDFHAMICQVGKVSVRRGQWYRLAFWARAEGLLGGGVEVALSRTRPWGNAGLADAFVAGSKWAPFEFRFRATDDLPAEASRLQFWFKSAGTLWLDDMTLTPTENGQEWFPQISAAGVKNLVPNSSFECGTAGWGSFTYGLSGWAGNLYRLEGVPETLFAQHGRTCLKIALNPATLPVFWFDYYEPVRQPVKRVLAANHGWFRVKPGESFTLSAFLRADADDVSAQLLVNEAPSRTLQKTVKVGRNWTRHSFTFVPSQPFFFIAVGLDLEASKRDAASLWVDSIQLERGRDVTDYEPRQAVESFVETLVEGNVFTNVQQGATFIMRAFNNSDRETEISGRLAVTDYFDKSVAESAPSIKLPAHSDGSMPIAHVGAGRRGFLRANWSSAESSNSVRAAIIVRAPAGLTDSPFGFNHAYPWDFLVRRAREAGIVWWRDWSAKWQTVEPEKGRFAFSVADAQIHRVLGMNSQVEVLLPFPSASWSTTAPREAVEKAAGDDRYLRARLPVAYAPQDLNDFGNYAAAVAKHYRGSGPRPVTHYQILNEPVYTDYALPGKFGYKLDDYLTLLDTAYRAMKQADPECLVVGGISAGVDAGWTRDFVTKGGLRSVDVFDLHIYSPAVPAESFEGSFQALEETMRAHGGPKPVWITEWGCYADDDPPCVPQTVGDATMNRCRWPGERAATENIVRFAAVSFAHGVRKIFFHAGTCGSINGPDAGGVLFEYGGAPRKMYPGLAALTEFLGVPEAFVKKIERGGLRAYLFRSQNQIVAVAWNRDSEPRRLRLAGGTRAFDVMGNELAAPGAVIGESPVYVTGSDAEEVSAAFAER